MILVKKMKKMLYILIIISLLAPTMIIAQESSGVNEKNIVEEKQEPNKKWNIKFSNIIDLSTMNSENIYITDFEGNVISSAICERVGEKEIMVTNFLPYDSNKAYILNISKNLKSTYGKNLNSDIKHYFTAKAQEKSYFNLTKAKYVTNQKIQLFFDKPVDDMAEIPLFYDIVSENGQVIQGSLDNMEVQKIPYVDNGVSISLKKDILKQDLVYAVKVKGDLKSAYGDRINSGLGDVAIFQAKSVGEEFKVTEIKVINEETMEIQFSDYIDKSATLTNNYFITSPTGYIIKASKVEQVEGNKVRVKLNKKFTEIGQYTLEIIDVKDLNGMNSIKNKKELFNVNSIEKAKLNFEAKAVDKNTVEIIFSEKVDKASATNKMNYLLEHRSSSANISVYPNGIYYDEINKDRVKLSFSTSLDKDKTYSLKVKKDIKNIYNEAYEIDSVKNIIGTDELRVFKVDSVKKIGSQKVEVKFNNEIELSGSNFNPENYKLQFKEGENRLVTINCSKVEYSDNYTLVLTFDGMKENESYLLIIEKIFGYFGEVTTKYKDGVVVQNN